MGAWDDVLSGIRMKEFKTSAVVVGAFIQGMVQGINIIGQLIVRPSLLPSLKGGAIVLALPQLQNLGTISVRT